MTDPVSLRDYFEARVQAVEKGTSLARGELERRLEGMNEFREQLRDQASRFITRDEVEQKISLAESRVNGRLDLIESHLATATKGKISWGVATAITLLSGAVVALITSRLV